MKPVHVNPAPMELAQASSPELEEPARTPAQALPPELADPTQAPAGAPTQASPADPAALLEKLHDIQLPAAVPWWPPAPGWWVLLGVALLVYLGWRYEWHTRWRPRPHAPAPLAANAAALAALERARAAFAENGDAGALAAELSVLLRRVAMGLVSRDETAALTGEPWLKWLDAQVEGESFSAGPGRALADAPYRAPGAAAAEVDGDALLQLCEEWVQAMFRRSAA